MRKRYSYSFANASRFFSVYDKLLDIFNNPAVGSRKISVSCDQLQASPETLQNRIMDGLKWLSENYDIIEDELRPRYTKADYGHLKLLVRSEKKASEVILELLVTKTTGITIRNVIENSTPETKTEDMLSNFRLDVEQFLVTPMKAGDEDANIKMFKNLSPTEADISWINGLSLSSPNLIFNWAGRNLTIVKVA